MSSIDQPHIIRDLIKRNGLGANYSHDGKRVIDSGRHQAYHIWQYITGFGGICYKLIYGLYPNGMDEKEASIRFLGTANIKPNTTPVCIYRDGKLTLEGEIWWQEFFPHDPMPMKDSDGKTIP